MAKSKSKNTNGKIKTKKLTEEQIRKLQEKDRAETKKDHDKFITDAEVFYQKNNYHQESSENLLYEQQTIQSEGITGLKVTKSITFDGMMIYRNDPLPPDFPTENIPRLIKLGYIDPGKNKFDYSSIDMIATYTLKEIFEQFDIPKSFFMEQMKILLGNKINMKTRVHEHALAIISQLMEGVNEHVLFSSGG